MTFDVAPPPIQGPLIKGVCHVVVTAFDLTDDDQPGKCVPAYRMAELIRKAVMKQAHPSVRRQVIFTFKPSDAGKAPLLEMRAKVEVSVHVAGVPSFAPVSPSAGKFMFELRDDIIEIIENVEPPKSAWVLNILRPRALKEAPSDRHNPVSGRRKSPASKFRRASSAR